MSGNQESSSERPAVEQPGSAFVAQVLDYIGKLLNSPVVPEEPEALAGIEGLEKLRDTILDVRSNLMAIARGDLSGDVKARGVCAGALKAQLAHLRHLTWQVQQVAAGDFSQRVDFLGDFSLAFNSMVEQLDSTLNTLRQKEEILTNLTRNLQQEVELRSSAVYALRQSEAKFRYLAEHDSLTGILNRRSFLALAEAELKSAGQNQIPCCFALLDVDHFKHFNDTYGHLEGDLALKHVVGKAQESLRQTDIIGRYGGEEFILLFSSTNLEQGRKAAERIISSIANSPVQLPDMQVPITASAGVSVVLPEWEEGRDQHFLHQIVRQADTALYQAKKEGRNRVCVAQPEKPILVMPGKDVENEGGGNGKGGRKTEGQGSASETPGGADASPSNPSSDSLGLF